MDILRSGEGLPAGPIDVDAWEPVSAAELAETVAEDDLRESENDQNIYHYQPANLQPAECELADDEPADDEPANHQPANHQPSKYSHVPKPPTTELPCPLSWQVQ
jgi:hypothetical protein